MNIPLINRRDFTRLIALASVNWPLVGFAKTKALGKEVSETYQNLTDPWLSISVVQEHLFPADDISPGAQDIGALHFLQNLLAAPDADMEEKKFMLKGVDWLNDLSVSTHKKVFVKLSNDEKEKILRKIESSRAGSRWLSLMMTYLIEALLSDPIYGGNADKKGWQWLSHQPGFPTPSLNQVYFRLVQFSEKNTRRRTKS